MVAMVLIFMMSLLGVTAMRESSLEKKMTTNSVHKSSTFQSAESATDLVLGNPDNLSNAFNATGVMNVQIPASSNLEMQTTATINFVGSGPPVGFSLGGGGFQALRYVVEGKADIPAVQSSSRVHQGAYRTVPALSQ